MKVNLKTKVTTTSKKGISNKKAKTSSNSSNTKNVTTKKTTSKTGRKSKTSTDISRRQYKIEKAKLKAQKNANQIELEKVKSNNAAKVALGGEVATGVSGTVTGSTSIAMQQQRVDGGLSNKGGLGREEAKDNNSGNSNSNSSWEDIINGLGK